VISGKAYQIGKYLFILTGLTFGDCSSPPSWEPFAAAQMALSTELSKGKKPVPRYKDYLNDVAFAPQLPPGTVFAKARPNGYNPGVMIMGDGSYPAAPLPMHVDNCLYAAAGQRWMCYLMRCSIGGLVRVMGGNAPDLWADQPDCVKLFRDKVSHTRRQLGYIMDTHTMIVSTPEDKHQALLTNLVNNWGPISGRQYFTLSEAVELLGVLVLLCRVCPWGIFLFQNLYHAVAQILRSSLRRVWN
jgi:hypothetical protein